MVIGGGVTGSVAALAFRNAGIAAPPGPAMKSRRRHESQTVIATGVAAKLPIWLSRSTHPWSPPRPTPA